MDIIWTAAPPRRGGSPPCRSRPAGRYKPLYNPGGPGNDPAPGVHYSAPSPPISEPVIDALNNPMTFTYRPDRDRCRRRRPPRVRPGPALRRLRHHAAASRAGSKRTVSVSDPTHESVARTGCAFGTAASTDKRDRIIDRVPRSLWQQVYDHGTAGDDDQLAPGTGDRASGGQLARPMPPRPDERTRTRFWTWC